MLIRCITTTPNGATWADARACGSPAVADSELIRVGAGIGFGDGGAVKQRKQAPVSGGFYGTHVFNGMASNGTTTQRPKPHGGRAG